MVGEGLAPPEFYDRLFVLDRVDRKDAINRIAQ